MKTAKRILILAGILCCLYAACILALIASSHWFDYAGFIVGGFLIAVGLLLEPLRSLVRKTPKAVLAALLILILAACSHFVLFEAKVIGFAASAPDPDAGYMIILGAKVNGDTPSLEFRRRIDTALDYAREHEDLIIICTGGKGSDEGIPEAAAAYNCLLAGGIDEARLRKEEKSTSTAENFLYAKEFMDEPSGVIVVSSAFHLYRAGLLAERAGYTDVSFLGSTGLRILEPHYYVREYAAYVKGLLLSE